MLLALESPIYTANSDALGTRNSRSCKNTRLTKKLKFIKQAQVNYLVKFKKVHKKQHLILEVPRSRQVMYIGLL